MIEKEMVERIKKLKEEKNAIILAHNYVTLDVQDVADFVGDSLQLSIEASKAKADVIVFCGVRFMAETAKILSPKIKVLLPVEDAGCPMADMIDGNQLEQFKQNHPQATVICYVNSTAEVKAGSDICCTSSNAVKIIESLPKDEKILFVPDQNLGTYAAHQTRRNITVWDGYCCVHHIKMTPDDVKRVKRENKGYKLLVHPECPTSIVKSADIVGSTKGMADYAKEHDNLIIGTEVGLYEQIKRDNPGKNIVPLAEKAICNNMKKIFLPDVLRCLEEDTYEVTLPEELRIAAKRSIDKMLSLS
ncbi:MAG: quinolinate synthase [Candidatus Cloacimonetes bacterium 4572_65]|nr:MAG: quinolinate synthase [Candidatus Cloacimonetes bacterium 4572_65]